MPDGTVDTETEAECLAAVSVSGSTSNVLVCNLAPGHEGLHFDETDQVWWREADDA
jgi:hypothetical protein